MLSLRDLKKSFEAVAIAGSITLDVPQGQALGILGPNGAGKTSLFNLIVGAIPVDAGSIALEGQDITAMPAAARCHLGIARSYQVPHPFVGMTVYENCLTAACFGGGLKEKEAARHCAEVLHLCGLEPKGDLLAGGLTLLERKRLELARVLSSRPRLLLLDEIAGGLTEPECEALVRTIPAVRETGATIVWIEHVLYALTEIADRAILLAGGHVLADAAPGAIMDDPVVREIYMGAPAVLLDVDLQIDEGETVAVMGANGAGKSTLFNVIAGGRAARSGAVSFMGRDHAGASPEEITAAVVACVPERAAAFLLAHCRGKPADGRPLRPPRRMNVTAGIRLVPNPRGSGGAKW